MLWRELAAEQQGAISRRQLAAAGLAHGVIARLIAARELERIGNHGVYLVGGAPWTLGAKLWAAALMSGGAIGFASAAHLWGITAAPPPGVHVVVPHQRRPRMPDWIVVHRGFVADSMVVRRDGLPRTTRTQTVLDHLSTLSPADAQTLADRGVQRRWLTAASIERRLIEQPRCRGNTLLRTVLSNLGDGAAAQSERVLHRLLRSAGLSGWEPNYQLWAGGQLIAVVDVAFAAARLAIEVDGWAFHNDVTRFQGDRWRQNDLSLVGWRVLRFTWADITRHPERTVSQIRRMLEVSGTDFAE